MITRRHECGEFVFADLSYTLREPVGVVGQIAGSRLCAHKKVYDRVVAGMADIAGKIQNSALVHLLEGNVPQGRVARVDWPILPRRFRSRIKTLWSFAEPRTLAR
jgi:hypothetical protein